MQYWEHLHEEITQAFSWAEQMSGQNTNVLRVLLTSGAWVQGELVSHSDATFTVQTAQGSDGEYTNMEIPYHGVAALERRSVR